MEVIYFLLELFIGVIIGVIGMLVVMLILYLIGLGLFLLGLWIHGLYLDRQVIKENRKFNRD